MQSAADTLMDVVCHALDGLVETAQPYHGLIPSLLDRRTGAMLTQLPAPIPGQRNGDRAHLGSNLMHDESTLKTLYGMAIARNRPDYAAAADAYLRRFATHCTATATGLFPWGEHSYWHLVEDRVGNSYVDAGSNHPAIHDHLRQAPLWLWDKLWAFNPACVERFAEGLDFHWKEGKREEYIRHARIEERTHPGQWRRSCDFPRHGGFYILDWAYAWTRTGRADFMNQIRDMLDYWWNKRDDRGLLMLESRSPEDDERFRNTKAPGQTLSLAASFLDSAEMLAVGAPEVAEVMRERAGVYIDAFFAAPHDLENNKFVIHCRWGEQPLTEWMPIWGSRYGLWPAAYIGLTALSAYRQTDDSRLLDWAAAAGKAYLTEPFPGDTAVPAMDAGLGLALVADLYDITGDVAWRDGALTISKTLADVYLDERLPRGAAGIDWYESQMGPGFILLGLARTALLAESRSDCPLAADYTAR